MSKNSFLVFIFSTIFLFQYPSNATDDEKTEERSIKKIGQQELTLIVGNTREKGGVKKSLVELVGQEDADFTHKKSFPGDIVSVDIAPLLQQGPYKHLILDFVQTKPQQIMTSLGGIHPTRIFFEWFPSCVEREPGNNITPLLLPALKNAFELLADNGELIIEHMPHAVYLPDSSSQAVKSLLEETKIKPEYLKIAAPYPSRTQVSGVISQLLQKADPFTIHINRAVHDEIREYLKNKAKGLASSPQKYSDYKIIDQIINLFAQNFSVNVPTMAAMINNGLVGYYHERNEEYQGYFDLFDQHYYMRTQALSILQTLSGIGFKVDHDSIQYYAEPNSFNGRKHSWIIKAIK